MKMTRTRWMKTINREYRRQHAHRKLVKTPDGDPRWAQLGDYYLINTRTNGIVLANIVMRDFLPKRAVLR